MAVAFGALLSLTVVLVVLWHVRALVRLQRAPWVGSLAAGKPASPRFDGGDVDRWLMDASAQLVWAGRLPGTLARSCLFAGGGAALLVLVPDGETPWARQLLLGALVWGSGVLGAAAAWAVGQWQAGPVKQLRSVVSLLAGPVRTRRAKEARREAV
jgi:hypothetical protein